MLISVLLLSFTLLAIQPVVLNFEADVHGGFGDIKPSTDMNSKTITSFKNPLNGDKINLNSNLTFNTSLNKFNATAHFKGQVEVPAYVLAMAAYSNRGDIELLHVQNISKQKVYK
ncbi:MAG: hypothetical protein PHW62_00450 [Candidatus Ratteibacteria bacterium]|nr:hypothetical protein [Candidatus Ratteibacteria bacterium]